MNLKVWSEENIKNCSDDQLFLRLLDNDGDIHLKAVDKSGNVITDGNLMIISSTLSCMVLMEFINQKIPLKTSIRGGILSMTEEELDYFIEQENRRKFMMGVKQQVEKQFHEHQKNCSSKH